jgi:hypothetical protein
VIHDSAYHPDAIGYPDGWPYYPDAQVGYDGGSSCGGACPDAAYVPDACGGG